jgi:pSer/pThr/pTyr-binding forkhead associated (FHA) protein
LFKERRKSIVKCPVCQRENPENTPFCNECGSYLFGGTGNETDLLPNNRVTWMNREETTRAPGVDVTSPLSLNLTIPDSGRDVEVPLMEEVTIGRLDPASASFPDVDLTTDDALDRGVSRRHAKITRRGHEVFIEDLGSMNGTFVNRKKLTPYLPETLRNGDQLQLGKLMLRVSFTK